MILVTALNIDKIVIKWKWLIIFIFIFGCESTVNLNNKYSLEDDYVERLIEYQSARVDRVKFLTGYGVIEGEKDEKILQGDFEFWFLPPDQISVRITKLGEVISWLGYTDGEPWSFEQVDEKMYLREGVDFFEANTHPPAIFRSLMGFEPIPSTRIGHGLIQGKRLSFTPNGLGAEWRVVYFLEPPFYLPFRVKVFQDNDLVVESVINQESYRPVTEKGRSQLNSIKAPSLLQIYNKNGERLVKLKLDFLSTIKDDQPIDAVFDLSKLIEFLRPEERVD